MHLGHIVLRKKVMNMIRSYDELVQLTTFDERFAYLKLDGLVGEETFGFDRWLNQVFYKTPEWRKARRDVIIRDCGYDLGCETHPINGQMLIVHHMNPIKIEDIKERSDLLLNPRYLITTIDTTHKAIHYGDSSYPDRTKIIERLPNDTCPWR